ncbi:putative dehydrogenase [Halanaerobium saccharolyticum]|uniref:Putative dehydrogenase n=1 Tax=Halanaerobium saccharolyticum TaxID=43595 RepID=A0A4R7Z7A7_9FIRM|nr:Gfo/Idh/MocA family oxidoreductase [Halanaerobium saccharolyticum]RAK12441.1 putative dehydrogenase [Halanaerobium saccharolyticum]TDW06367.1 putative dehydrogenase [Halanaerobium saccharolyticum]TDX61615.1 putative dehydrogenase [Halanaerobium saccharolyticum]
MKNLNAAIVGCGSIYKVHADALIELEKVKLKYVVDIREERAKKAAEEYNCSYLLKYEELLNKEIDVVHICTPHFLHSPMAVKFLEAGINVFVEKPLALNYQDGQNINAALAQSQAKLGVCFQNRFNDNNQQAKKIIESGKLGEIKGIKGFVTWHRSRDYYLKDDWKGFYETEGGGVLINQAIHTLDLMQWFGGQIKAVKGNIDTRVLNDVIEVEDTAEATLYFESGALGIFYATNTFSQNSPIEIVIDCENGSMRLFNDQLVINQGDNKSVFNADNQGDYKSYWGNSHHKIIELFYQDLLADSYENIVTAAEGLKTLTLIKYINLSAQNNKKFHLENESDY